MADERWGSARADAASSACSAAPATDQRQLDAAAEPPESGLHGAAFLDGPPHLHTDWTQDYMLGGATGGHKAAAEAASGSGSFNALLQLHGDGGFLLDQPPPHQSASSSSRGVALLMHAAEPADNQYASSVAAMTAMKQPFPQQQQQQQQQFSAGFFASPTTGNNNFGPVTRQPPAQLLLQARDHEAFKSHATEPVQDACSSSATTRSAPSNSPAPAKKPRIATPSPLPTFKVRKEKLGDRITALQQLVSPFGKTDTASVLHEAIEYIRFLHDQVASLSSPHQSCGRPVEQLQQQQDGGEAKEDLRSRGLCLVPVASTTYTVASETAPEFLYPTFGGTFR